MLTVLTQKPPFSTGNLRLLTLAAPATTVTSEAKDLSGCGQAARRDHCRPVAQSSIRPADNRRRTWSGDGANIWVQLFTSSQASDNCAAELRGRDRGCVKLGSSVVMRE